MATVQQYKRILSIAEALLRKVDMPEQTIHKYESLKQKILSDPNFELPNNNNQNLKEEIKVLNLESKIKDLIIQIFENLMLTNSQILQNFSETQNFEIPKISTTESLTIFYENFNLKKSEIQDIVVESDISGDMKQALKTYIDDMDKISKKFDEFFEVLASVQKNFFENFEKEKIYEEKITVLEKEIDECTDRLKAQDEVVALYEELKEENLELKTTVNRLENELNLIKETAENLDEEKKILDENFELYNEKIGQVIEKFKGYCEEYGDFYEGKVDFEDFEDVFNFVDLLIKKLELDSKEILGKNEELEIEVKKLQSEKTQKENIVKSSVDMVQKVGHILKQNEEKFRDFETLEKKFEKFVKGPLGIKPLKIN